MGDTPTEAASVDSDESDLIGRIFPPNKMDGIPPAAREPD